MIDRHLPVSTVNSIPIYNMDGATKTMNRNPVFNKLTNFTNIFYYLKFIAEMLNSKVYAFKQDPQISADEYDIMYVMTKKIKEALIDGYNSYQSFQDKNAKL